MGSAYPQLCGSSRIVSNPKDTLAKTITFFQVGQHNPVIPVRQEAEAVGSKVQGSPELHSELKTSLGNLIGLCLKIRIKRRSLEGCSAAQSASCSSRSPRLGSQYPHGCSQLPITPVSGDLTPFSDPLRIQSKHMVHIRTSDRTLIHKK